MPVFIELSAKISVYFLFLISKFQNLSTYESFVNYLKDFKVTHALYLDMGSGWNYAWYRNKDGSVKEIFPESKISPCYKYRTNWIAFYK